MRYFACISYNGSLFNGWQKQHNSKETIQQHMDHCLSVLLREEISTVGCGRTDTGVHARGFYLHFDANKNFNTEDVIYHSNKILPQSIVIHDIFEVNQDLHARFDAVERSYVYRIKVHKDPFDAFHYYFPHESYLKEVEVLNEVAQMVMEARDFTSYCKTHTDVKTNLCEIKSCYWKYNGQTFTYEFHITANRFLRGMIRLIVGMMLNVSRKKITLEEAKSSLFEQTALTMSWSVPADGLILHNVSYGSAFNRAETAPYIYL